MSQTKIAIATKDAPAAIGPYSQAVRVGDMLFTSGQVALDPATGNLVPGGIEAQTTRVLENLKAVLGAAGIDLVHVVVPPSAATPVVPQVAVLAAAIAVANPPT